MHLDDFMSDWREKFYGQHNANNLGKIARNIDDCRVLLGDRSLLDVGCNIGAVYEDLRHKNYLGIDIDPKVIEEARKRFPGVEFKVLDLFELEGSWDIVLVSRVLMHVPLDEAMKRLLKSAKKYLILFVPIADEDCCEIHGHNVDGETVHSYYRRFSEKTLRSFGDCSITKREPYSTVVYDR